MKKYNLILAMAIVWLLASCAPKLVSNKAGDYSKQPKRLFVEFVHTSEKGEAGNNFTRVLHSLLAAQNIESTELVHSNLSFDTDDDIARKAADFKADAIMYIRQSYAIDKAGYGNFNITLYDAETKKPFWKSTFELGDQQAVAESLIKKLKQDGIIADMHK